jgi:transcription elongation factor GreA
MHQETLLTADGLARIQHELDELVSIRRPAIAARIKEARELGDLKENAEYHDAKNEQALVETRIQQLEARVRTARVVEASDASVVTIGTSVTVTDLGFNETDTWHITGAADADPMEQRISNESPIGSALMGTRVGDVVDVQLPNGTTQMRVDAISIG